MNNKKRYRVYKAGGKPCYECGGGTPNNKFGGSTAPQNANINSIGKSQTEKMKNYLAKNVEADLNNKELALVQQMKQQQQQMVMQMQPMMVAGGGTGKTTSVYNPNLYGQRDARDAVVKNKWDAEKNFASLWGGLQEIGANQEAQNAQDNKPKLPSNFNPNFSSPASMQFSGAPEGTTQGQNPFTGAQASFAPGHNPYITGSLDGMAMGGDLPKHQTNGIVAPSRHGAQAPMPQDLYEQYGTYKPLNEQEKRWVDAERLKKRSPNNKGLNPKFSGVWDAASDPNEGAYEWKSRGATMNMLAPDLAMSDPRRHRAIQNVIPGYGGGSDESVWSSIRDAAQMPQYMVNEAFTGYYEDPGETYMRYVNKEDNWGGFAPFAMSMGTDPWILATPGQLVRGGKLMGKTAAMMPFDMAKDIGVTAEQAAVLIKKYGPAVLEKAVKSAKYIGKKGEQVYKYVDDIAKKIFTNKFVQELAPRAQAAGLKLNPWAEDTDPFSNRNFKANESTEASRMFTGQTVPMPSSTIQQPVGPPPGSMTLSPNQEINTMTLEELQAITGVRKYGGDAPLPMAKDGQETSLMMQKYWKPAEIEQARQRQAQMQALQWAQNTTNPWANPGTLSDHQRQTFEQRLQQEAINNGANPNYVNPYGIGTPISNPNYYADHQAAATAVENEYSTETETETETSGTGNTGKGKKKKTTPAGTTETSGTDDGGGGADDATNTTRGNYKGSEGTSNGGYYDPNYYNQGYNYNQGYGYGNGPRGRHVKKTRYKEFDPVTGKKIRQWRDKDVQQGSRGNSYFGGRRGMPRKIKLHQDVYQNAQFNQAGYNPQYGPYQDPQERAAQEATAVQGVNPGVAANDMSAVPRSLRDPILAAQHPTPPMESGMGVMANIPSPYAPGFDPYADSDPYGQGAAMAAIFENAQDAENIGSDNQGRGRGIFGGRRNSGVNPAKSNRIERRFNRQVAKDEAQGYAYGGESYFPQPYPGGMPDPNMQAPPYFMVEGGNTWDDPNNAVPEWIKNPLGQYGVGDTQTPNTGNAPYALTDKGQKTMEIDSKEKYGQNFGDQMSQYAPLIPGGVGMIGDILGEGMYGENAKAEAQAQALKSAANVNTAVFGNKGGSGTVNAGRSAPDQRVFAQSPGNNQGAWGAGNGNYYGQYGGQPQFAGGGEYYLDENEIAQLKAGGAVIEYL